MQPTDYLALRRAGWRALDAHRATRPGPAPWTDRARDLLDAGTDRAIEWTAGRYTMRAQLHTDLYADADEYGTFTNDTDDDTIPNPAAGSRDYKRFRPEYSIAEHVADNRRRGMTRADARAAAITAAELGVRRALDAWYAYLTVDATRAGVDLGSGSLSGLDLSPDAALPYSIGRSLTVAYLAETLADLTAEAIAQADDELPRIVAALAS